jgi:hypothetical protein
MAIAVSKSDHGVVRSPVGIVGIGSAARRSAMAYRQTLFCLRIEDRRRCPGRTDSRANYARVICRAATG